MNKVKTGEIRDSDCVGLSYKGNSIPSGCFIFHFNWLAWAPHRRLNFPLQLSRLIEIPSSYFSTFPDSAEMKIHPTKHRSIHFFSLVWATTPNLFRRTNWLVWTFLPALIFACQGHKINTRQKPNPKLLYTNYKRRRLHLTSITPALPEEVNFVPPRHRHG